MRACQIASPTKITTAIQTQMNAAIVAGVSRSPSMAIAIAICTVGERNWMKLMAKSGKRFYPKPTAPAPAAAKT